MLVGGDLTCVTAALEHTQIIDSYDASVATPRCDLKAHFADGTGDILG